MTNERVRVNSEGFANREGIVTPLGTRLATLNEHKGYFVLFIPGHKYWADRMSGQRYAAAEYVVYQIVGDAGVTKYENGSMDLRGSTVIDFPVRMPKVD